MTNPAPSCQVSFLVPHPERIGGHGRRWRSSTGTGPVADGVAVRRRAAGVRHSGLGRRPGHRRSGGPPDGDDLDRFRGGGEVTLLVECDAVGGALSRLDLAGSRCAGDRAAGAGDVPSGGRLVGPRAGGRDGRRCDRRGRGRAGSPAPPRWMVEQMAAAGRPAVGAPRQHHLWGISVVLRAPSADGDVFFKCTGDLFRHEAAVTRALARLMPDVMPEVIAVDEAAGMDVDARPRGSRAGRAGGIAVGPGHRGPGRNPAVDAGSYGRAGRPGASGPLARRAWPRGWRR